MDQVLWSPCIDGNIQTVVCSLQIQAPPHTPGSQLPSGDQKVRTEKFLPVWKVQRNTEVPSSDFLPQDNVFEIRRDAENIESMKNIDIAVLDDKIKNF